METKSKAKILTEENRHAVLRKEVEEMNRKWDEENMWVLEYSTQSRRIERGMLNYMCVVQYTKYREYYWK